MQSQLTEAALIAYSGTDPSSRQHAERYIEQVKKESGKGVAQVGFRYLDAKGNLVLRHFGYHLLETAVERHWEEYSEGEVQEWKQRLLEQCRTTDERVLQEKLSKVISMVCLRIWPQKWAELMPSLAHLWRHTPKSREMAQRVLLSISQEASLHNYKQNTPHEKGVSQPTGRWDSLNIEADRKSEIVTGLEDNAVSILQMVNSYFQSSVEQYMANPSSAELSTQMDLCIELVSQYGSRLTLHKVIVHNLTAWAQLIAHPEVCLQIADLLHDLIEPAQAAADDGKDWSAVLGFLAGLMGYIAGMLQGDLTQGGQRDGDELEAAHRFAVRLSDVLLAVAKHEYFVEMLVTNGHGDVLKSCMVSLVTHRDPIIHHHALVFLKKLLSCPKSFDLLMRSPGFMRPLLQCINDAHLLRVTQPPTGIDGIYYQLNFEDQEEEYLLHHGVLTSTHKEVATLLNRKCPGEVICALVGLLEELLGAYGQPKASDKKTPSGGGVAHDTEIYIKWGVADIAFMHFCDGLSGATSVERLSLPQELVTSLQSMMLKFTEHNVNDNSLLPRYLSILQCLAVMMCQNRSNVLGAVITKLVRLMPFKTEADQRSLTQDTIVARRRVHTVLVHLANVFDSEMEAHLGVLLQAWEHQESAGFTDHEVSLLAESLISLTGKLEGPQRDGVLCKIMEPMMAPWQAVQSLVASPQAFRMLVEDLLEGTRRKDLEAARNTLKKCLCVFQGVFRRSIPSSTSSSLLHLSSILVSPLLEFATTINTLMTPGHLTGRAAVLLTVTPEEKEQATGGSLAARETSNPVFHARQYVSQVRAPIYVLLGSLTAFNRDKYASYMTEVYGRLFIEPLKQMELLHLKYFWVDFCAPFILLTPQDAYRVLAKVFPCICGFIFERLSRGWMEWCAMEGNGAAFTNKGKVNTDEGWEYKVLADVSSEVVGAFFHVANISQGGLVGNTKLKKYAREPRDAQTVKEVCTVLCEDDRLVNAMLMILTAAITWPSPVSAVRAVEALQKLAPKIIPATALHPTLVHILGASLHRLASLKNKQTSTSANKESQLSNYLINLICEIYCGLYQSRPEPAQMLIQLGFSPEAVLDLNQSLAAEKQVSKKRQRFKVLLSPKKGTAAMIGNLHQYDIHAKAVKRQQQTLKALQSASDEYDCTLALSALFSHHG
eukprot:TRINITY_DN24932_c0_g1_i1.p1 TRINITY_DN24932_c0_g1~~TRINITY_DN24932_c0_g1_i1.p1  ORF type:complete len:1166 (+),score=383.07 TRINITY_DN24932_c0_g1_i1:98-3595(+)